MYICVCNITGRVYIYVYSARCFMASMLIYGGGLVLPTRLGSALHVHVVSSGAPSISLLNLHIASCACS